MAGKDVGRISNKAAAIRSLRGSDTPNNLPPRTAKCGEARTEVKFSSRKFSGGI